MDKRSSHNCCYYEPFVLLVIKMLIVMATMKTHKRRYYKGYYHNSLHITILVITLVIVMIIMMKHTKRKHKRFYHNYCHYEPIVLLVIVMMMRKRMVANQTMSLLSLQTHATHSEASKNPQQKILRPLALLHQSIKYWKLKTLV